MFKLSEFILRESNKESCPFIVNIVIFSHIDSRIRHEKHSCQSSESEKTQEVQKITFPTEKSHGIPNGIEMGEAFRFKTPSSILIVGPSGCGKTCFTKSLLLDHLEELFVKPPTMIHYCYGAWQDGFRDMKDAGVQFHEGVPLGFWVALVGVELGTQVSTLVPMTKRKKYTRDS